MKRIVILFIIINNSYGMQQPGTVAASPRTDEAAVKHKLRLMITDRDVTKLLNEIIPAAQKRIQVSRQSSYDLNNNLRVTFKYVGQSAEVYKINELGKSARELGEYSGTIEELKRLLLFIQKNPDLID